MSTSIPSSDANRKTIRIDGREYQAGEIDGPNGLFLVAPAGALPEYRDFVYKDANSCFFFSVFDRSSNCFFKNIEIVSASTKRNSGVLVKIEAKDKKSIENNIELFFKTRSEIFPWKEINKGPEIIAFSWRFLP